MTLEVVPGRKREDWPEDLVLEVNGYRWTIEDLFRALLFLFENEDRHRYPGARNFRGAMYLLDAIRDLERTRDLYNVLRKYGLAEICGATKLHELL